MRICSSLLFGLLLFVPSHVIAENSKDCDPQLGHLFSYYYESPAPLRVGELVSYLECAGGAPRPTAKTPLMSFFGAILRQSPEAIPIAIESPKKNGAHWAEIILNALWFCASQECRDALKRNPFKLPEGELAKLLAEPPPEVMKVDLNSAAALDLLWGYFGATGDTSVVRRILDLVVTNWDALEGSRKIDQHILLAAAAARWSISSQAAQHEKLLKLLREQDVSNPAISALIKRAEETNKQGREISKTPPT